MNLYRYEGYMFVQQEEWIRQDSCEFGGYSSEEMILYDFVSEPNAFPVVKETEKGYWIYDYNHTRFVLKGPGRRFAYPDKKSALDSFIRRKTSHVARLERLLRLATVSLEVATRYNPEDHA